MSFNHAISWFEIPTLDINRAQQFYEKIFEMKMEVLEFEGVKMRMFPLTDPMTGVGGALIQTDGLHNPSRTDGPLIYLNGNPDLQKVLERVEAAGGSVEMPKTEISPEYGFMGVIIDSEGNRIGLHNVPDKYL